MILVFNIILGLILGYFAPQYTGVLQYFDVIFLKLLNLITPFLIFTMILKSIAYLNSNIHKNNHILLTTLYYTFGTLLSVIIAFAASYLTKIGLGLPISFDTTQALPKQDNVIINLIPNNIICDFYHGNLIQILFTAILFGVITSHSKHKNEILKFTDQTYEFLFEILESIMILIPYALLSLTIKLTISNLKDLLIFAKMLKLIFALYCLRYIVLLLEIYLIGGVSPLPFILKSFRYQSVAFISTSSKATLPIASEELKNMGVSKENRQYAVSIGGMLNSIGFGLDLTVIIVFILNIYSVELNLYNSIFVIILSFIGCIAGTGIPAAPLIVLSIVLNFFHISHGVIVFILGIDRIIDMVSTTINITGICGYTLVIDGKNKTLNTKKYYE